VPPEKIRADEVDVLRGFRVYDALNLAANLKVPTPSLPVIGQAIMGLYQTFKDYNCRTARNQSAGRDERRKGHRRRLPDRIDDSSFTAIPSSASRWPANRNPPTELDKIAWWIEEGDLRGTAYIAQMSGNQRTKLCRLPRTRRRRRYLRSGRLNARD